MTRWIALLTVLAVVPAYPARAAGGEQRLVDAPAPAPYRVWPSQTPDGCPFTPSKQWDGVGFTGRHAEYTHADTWYPSWAADGRLYSGWTDGRVDKVRCGSGGKGARVGHAILVGDDPLDLHVIEPGTIPGPPAPYEGRYPSAYLMHEGVWYIGTYCLAPSGRVEHEGTLYNWPWLGPFVGFHISQDRGKTWTPCPHTPADPLFGESGLEGKPVRLGALHVVDFGKAMEHSPDGKVYLVGHGASEGPEGRRFGYNSWITGDAVYLVRVEPGIATMNDRAAYEYFAGRDDSGQDTWSKDFAAIQPIARWKDRMGCVTITYNAALKAYMMCVTDGVITSKRFHTYILISDRLTGPWSLVTYMRHFGQQAYFVNLPSKFIGADGRTMWLCYSANYWWRGRSDPPGSTYALCLQELRLLRPGDPHPHDPLTSPDNVAPTARVTASSVHEGYSVAGVTDGRVDGYPRDTDHEWASQGEKDSALVRLTWQRPVTIDRVWLFDRPNTFDHVTGGMLVFPDGSTIRTGALPDKADKGLEVAFRAKTVKWLAFFVTEVNDGCQNIGLSELAVFQAKGTNTDEE